MKRFARHSVILLLGIMISALHAQDDLTFQVNMSIKSDEGVFNPGAGDIVVVRGEFNGWAGNAEQLFDANADKIYDGTFNIATGTSPQYYKFVIVNSNGDIWEGDPDREVNLTGSPQVLPVVWFDNDSTFGFPPFGSILFQLNMEAATAVGLFDGSANDSIFVYGSFNNWGPNDNNFLLQQIFGEPFGYELNAGVIAEVGSLVQYKYYLNRNDSAFEGWEEPPTMGGGNRIVTYQGTNTQVEPMRWFMDIPNEGVISSGSVTVHLSVDMTPALSLSDPFDPAVDHVYFSGEDQFMGWTQGWDPQRGVQEDLEYSDVDGDLIYDLTLTLNSPTYYALVYRVCFGETPAAVTCEGGGFDFGKSRSRYIWDSNSGSIPTEITFATDVYTENPPLVVETHPHAGIVGLDEQSPQDEQLAAAFSLHQNYPNPFNPKTTIEFEVAQSGWVKLTVYNALGQQIKTLSDGQLNPGSYRVTWDGTNDNGAAVSSGIYFLRMSAGSFAQHRRMLLMK